MAAGRRRVDVGQLEALDDFLAGGTTRAPTPNWPVRTAPESSTGSAPILPLL